MQRTIDAVKELDIYEVIEKYMPGKLQKAGSIYKTRCPFHEENTASFTVTPAKGIFKCFGCGKAGDAITFVMEHEKLSFYEALQDIASKFNLKPPKKLSQKEQEKADQERKHKEALRIVNEFAKDHWAENQDAVAVRINEEAAEAFEIGFAIDAWDDLKNQAGEKGYKQQIMQKAGLLANKNGKVYDRFRGRIMFPVHDHRGRIAGFSGRAINDTETAKYINTPETEIFQKAKLLYGLFQARKSIERNNHAYLVEGPTDVTTLYGIGVCNVVAPLGTAFTTDQAKLLKKFCSSVTIIGDGDDPGQKAMIKTGQTLIQNGFSVYALELPEKEDPDSYFETTEQFEEKINADRKDYIIWYADKLNTDPDDPNVKSQVIDTICQILTYMPKTKSELYIESLAKTIKPKKQWDQQLKELRNEYSREGEEKETLPEGVDPTDVEKYGFYEYKNKYYFRGKEGGYYPVSNFILQPLFHIKLYNESSRLFEMRNAYGHSEIIEIDIGSMVSIQNFRRIIEGRGNYLFEGNETQFMRIKRKLYDNTKTCELIENLGWQKEGFFAFSNGIFNGSWKPIDKNGIVENNNKYYFIPALSDIYKDDQTMYLPERRFQFVNRTDITINSWSKQFIKVFGSNARIAIAFYCATLMKDYIFNYFKFFPMLNAFGPPGTGKSQIGWSLMYLFGEAQNPFNLHNGTKVGLAEHLAEFSNAFAWIDEYKNAVDYDKVEMLKGAYDGIGRKKGGIEKGKKTKTSTVNAGIVLTGQEMPTADVALLKRVILLQFYKNEFTDQEAKDYDRLKEIEKAGLSNLTIELLQHRQEFEREYFKIYDKVSSELAKELQNVDVEDRILRNMAIIVAAFRFFEDKADFAMNSDELMEEAKQNVIDQSSFILNSAEIKSFWDIIESAVANLKLEEDKDFVIDHVSELNTSDKGNKNYKVPKRVIYLRMSRIYEVYAETMKRTGQHALPKRTLLFYLKTSKEYEGLVKSVRFKSFVTNSYVFDYDKLGITLHQDAEQVDDPAEEPDEEKDDVPF